MNGGEMDLTGDSRQRLIELIDTRQFSMSRLRPGYTIQDVDAFLRAVRDGLAGMGEPVTAQQISSVQFKTTRLRAGYDEEEVDNFLDQLVAGLPR